MKDYEANSVEQFDGIRYLKDIASKCKLAKDNEFFVCGCAGIDGIGDILDEYQRHSNFIMVDDTTSQQTYSRGVSFFDKNVYTVFILASFEHGDMDDRAKKLRICRHIFRQMHSRMVNDKFCTVVDGMQFLDVNSVYSKEFPVYSLPDITGLYFMVNNDEPVDLQYDAGQWLD